MLIVLSFAAFAAAQSYTVTDLGPGQAYAINGLGDVVAENISNSFVWSPGGSILALPPLPGDIYTTPRGINSQGQAVGDSANHSGYTAVVWTNGVPLDLGTLPGGAYSWAYGINASGEVVGTSTTAHTDGKAFLWTQATGMQSLGILQGGTDSVASAINRFGQVVGTSSTNGGKNRYAFLWSKTTGMKSLGALPGGSSLTGGSAGSAMNDLGQVAGGSDCGSLCHHAVLWSKTKASILDLGLLAGESYSDAYGINNAGQVVGKAYSPGLNDERPFVWSPSTGMLDLNNLIPANSGWVLQFAFAINDKGQIVGGGTLNGQYEAFLLTPQ
jgi:probable HAF family extracellular repeat protein